jgi:hypothetical protein
MKYYYELNVGVHFCVRFLKRGCLGTLKRSKILSFRIQNKCGYESVRSKWNC